MKYNIEGFNQEKLVGMGLNSDDAIILRWFVDFYSTEKMAVVRDRTGIEFKWVKYQAVIDDLPILEITNRRVIARHFDKMVNSGILEKHIHSNKGIYTCFRLTEKYRLLIENYVPCTEKYIPLDSKVQTPPDSKVQTKDYSINLNHSIKYEEGQAPRSSKFIPPTVEQVREYCIEKGYKLNPEAFINFYESKNWMVGKNKMSKWKAAVSGWEAREKNQPGPAPGPAKMFKARNLAVETMPAGLAQAVATMFDDLEDEPKKIGAK